MEPNIKKYSVVIIGAGPAGSSAAKTLVKNGLSVALIDKSYFPRNKLCAGLLTGRSKDVFESIYTEENWDDIVEYTSDGYSFYNGLEKINDVNNYSSFYFTYRYKFDEFLVNSALSSGVESYLGEAVDKIDTDNDIIVLKNGLKLQYDYLIGADGVNSMVSKQIFEPLDSKNMALGLEIEVDSHKFKNTIIDKPEIYFGLVKWGYAWVFPKKQKMTIGVVGLLSKNKNLNKKLLSNFIQKRFNILVDEREIKGHHIPFGNYKSNPVKGNVLLCGDAAGLVEPITGEGIGFAMESGKLCAESIIESINSKESTIKNIYLNKSREIISIFYWAKVFRHVLYNPFFKDKFIKKLSSSYNMPRGYIDLLDGKVTYVQLLKKYFQKILKIN